MHTADHTERFSHHQTSREAHFSRSTSQLNGKTTAGQAMRSLLRALHTDCFRSIPQTVTTRRLRIDQRGLVRARPSPLTQMTNCNASIFSNEPSRQENNITPAPCIYRVYSSQDAAAPSTRASTVLGISPPPPSSYLLECRWPLLRYPLVPDTFFKCNVSLR